MGKWENNGFLIIQYLGRWRAFHDFDGQVEAKLVSLNVGYFSGV